jgi:thioredoxin-like negative regulator of GroEL
MSEPPPPFRRHAAGFLLLLCSLAPAAPARCQEVEWRTDYPTALREAREKNRPLLIDFGTENCFWCKKLDAVVFHEPAVAGLLNERFIPLRIDADREPRLAADLHIESYPTVVLASADRQILDVQVGFLEAARFQEKLQRALAVASSPEWMARDYDAAGRAIAASDYARAIALLRSIIEDGQQRPVQVKARQLLQDLEQQAAGRVARARQLVEKGQTTEAMETLTELVRVFAGTQAAAEGGRLLTGLGNTQESRSQQRTRRARELLAQAREEYRTQQYLCCLNRCDVLMTSFPELPEGVEAMQLAAEIKNNPEWMRLACDTLSDQLGTLYLSLAETWLKKGQPEQAVICLERVVQTLPGTRQAEAAQVRLAQIQGQPPTQAVDFKPKP